jgi:cellobiose transport system substrate-binding protein
VTLQMWGFANLSQPLVAQYQKDHPNITVNTKISDYDAAHQTLTTALAAGKVPDIAQIAIDYMGEFVANSGSFTDLRKYSAQNLASQYLGWRWQGGVASNGAVVGLPTDVGGMAIAYRTDLFQSAGLPTDPAAVSALWPTWAGYIAAGQKYVAATGKKFIDSGKSVFRAESNQGSQKYTAAGGSLIFASNPVIKSAWDDGTKAIAAGLSADLGTYTPQWDAALANGGVATMIAPAWMLSSIEQQAPATRGKWNIATLPGTAGNDGGSFLAIPKNAAHPKEAYDFISWLESPANQLALFKENNTFPSVPALYADPAVQGYTDPFFGNAPVGKIYSASVQAVKPFPVGPKDRLIEQQFENAIYSVDQHKASADQAWQSALSGAKREAQG